MVQRGSSRCPVQFLHLVQVGQDVPRHFALKELKAPAPFPVGSGAQVREYLPLQEAAIQQYMNHPHIVKIYWADVRCLHPDREDPLRLSVAALSQHNATEQAAEAISASPQGGAAGKANGSASGGGASGSGSSSSSFSAKVLRLFRRKSKSKAPPTVKVKLQMRMGLEFCDLGSLVDYLARNPEDRDGWSLKAELRQRHKKLVINVDDTLCALYTALDVAEALKFMHKSKTLHGDLKPHNILMSADPQVGTAQCSAVLHGAIACS